MKGQKKAAALKYAKGASAPMIAASGKGFLAKRILEIAEREKIPIVQNDSLAEFLTVQEIGAEVPEETWEVLAKIFAFVLKLERKRNDVAQN